VAPNRFCRGNALLVDDALTGNRSFFMPASIDPNLPAAIMIVPHRHAETPFEFDATR